MNEIINKKVDWTKDVERYRKGIDLIVADVPIAVLCLPPNIEEILLKEGKTRVFDLLIEKLTSIRGIGDVRAGIIVDCLRKFIPVPLEIF
jgi:hypothetical protein